MPETAQNGFAHDVVVIGGGGHVGLPLAIALADRGASVVVLRRQRGGGRRGELRRGCRSTSPGAAPVIERAVAAGRLVGVDRPGGGGRLPST